jgi:hypothetical protein
LNSGPLALNATARTSGRHLTRVSPDHLLRLSEGAQEGAAHAVAICNTRLPSDDVDRMATPSLVARCIRACGIDAEVYD